MTFINLREDSEIGCFSVGPTNTTQQLCMYIVHWKKTYNKKRINLKKYILFSTQPLLSSQFFWQARGPRPIPSPKFNPRPNLKVGMVNLASGLSIKSNGPPKYMVQIEAPSTLSVRKVSSQVHMPPFMTPLGCVRLDTLAESYQFDFHIVSQMLKCNIYNQNWGIANRSQSIA